MNKRLQVCMTCMDKPSVFLRPVIIPADPPPIYQPRTETYAIDEAGGYATPVFIATVGVVVQVPVPSWASGFLTDCYGSGASGSVLNGSYPNIGGGGTAFSRTLRIPVTGGSFIYVFVAPGGTAGGNGANTWASLTNAAPTSTANGCSAQGGFAPDLTTLPGPTIGRGGQASACIGDLTYSGGDGGLAAIGPGNTGGTGGGGAAGPEGPGSNASDTTATNNGSHGGSSDGVRGQGTGGLGSAGTAAVMATLGGSGENGKSDYVYAMAGGAGGGAGAGGGGPSLTNADPGGAGGVYGGGGGGGGYGAAVNGLGGPGGHGFCVIRWLQ
jgi:hypothetical protein